MLGSLFERKILIIIQENRTFYLKKLFSIICILRILRDDKHDPLHAHCAVRGVHSSP